MVWGVGYTVKRSIILVLFAASTAAAAEDVYVPPVLKGIAREGKTRTAKRPIPFPAENEPWIRVRTPRFELVSSATEERTRGIAADLETLAAALKQTSARFQSASVPTTVFVFADRRESQPYFDLLVFEQTKLTGLFVRHSGGGTMFIDAARRGFERTAMHELVHDLLRQSQVSPPLWVEEGMAEYFANADIRGSQALAGRRIEAHLQQLTKKPTRTLEDMFAVRAESVEATSPYFYAQSWAAVDWLMSLDPKAFYAFVHDLEDGVEPLVALETHFKKSREEFASALRTPRTFYRQVKIDIPPVNVKIDVTKVERADLLFELGRFLTYVAGAETEAERHMAEALRVNPQHARTLARLGRFEDALAVAPDDPDIHLGHAETLLGSALGDFAGIFEPEENDVERFREARASAERALELGGDEGRARAAIGVSLIVETDPLPAIAQLERARELSPSRMDVALNLYSLYLDAGQQAKADALFDAAFENARDKQIVFAARNIRVQSETERANELAREGKLEEAAVIVRGLAGATSDPMGRRELEQQAAQLDSIATVNRHISLYNKAVAAANAGKNREARKILDELLEVATDEQVVRDAQRLRRKVGER